MARYLSNINSGINIAIHSNRNEQSIKTELEAVDCMFMSKPISRRSLLSFILSSFEIDMKILLIEDSPLMAAMWKSKLSSCELDVIASKEQVELVLEKNDISYDLIILDRYLGDVDSLEYLYPKKLKAVFNCPIVLSSNADLGDEEINGIDLEVGKNAISLTEIKNRLKGNTDV